MKNRMLSYDKVLGLPLLLLVSMLAGGCSLAEGPENPEPELTMLEPSGIGRREVTLSAVTDSRGGEVFSSVRFIYGESSGEKRTFSEDVTLVNGKGSITLDGLTPGSFYTSCAEAHYGTATIRSPYVSFSTLPIDPPALGSGALLSRGPTGFVLGFSVTDEGGDPITEAGCELTDLLTGQTRHEGVREALTGTGDYTVTVTRLNPGHRYSVTPYAANVSGFAWGGTLEFETSESFIVTEPGRLSEMLGEAGLPESRLVIAGPLDGDDFRVIREVFTTPGGKPSLDFLDISGVSICEGGGFYDGHRHTECDVITSGLFAGLDRLTGIVLPMTAVTVMRDAFSVTPLVSLSIPPGVRDVLPSADCAMLESVEVSPGNRFFRSVEGVLYDAEITRIVWFPQAKKGEYVIPSTVRSIGEYAFRNTSVTSLVIPDGVTDISRGAFSGSALTSIIIPPGLTNIAEGLFQDCPSLICLHLGAATEYIGAYAFDGAPLRELQLEAEFPPVVKAETFSSSSGDLFDTCVLKVPYSSIPLYRNHKYWGRFSTIKSL